MQRPKDNARFLCTENKILRATKLALQYRGFHCLRVIDICRLGPVRTSTFYRHYSSTHDLFSKVSNRFILELHHLTGGFNPATNLSPPARQFRKLLLFLYQRENLFLVAIEHPATAQRFSYLLQPLLTQHWHGWTHPKVTHIYRIHSAEILTEILIWSKDEQFNLKSLDTHVHNLTFLSHTVRTRLSSIKAG